MVAFVSEICSIQRGEVGASKSVASIFTPLHAHRPNPLKLAMKTESKSYPHMQINFEEEGSLV